MAPNEIAIDITPRKPENQRKKLFNSQNIYEIITNLLEKFNF